jgi:hypothetical protein
MSKPPSIPSLQSRESYHLRSLREFTTKSIGYLLVNVDERTRYQIRAVNELLWFHFEPQSETLGAFLQIAAANRGRDVSTRHLDVLIAAVKIDTIILDGRHRPRIVDGIDDVFVVDDKVVGNLVHVNDDTTNVCKISSKPRVSAVQCIDDLERPLLLHPVLLTCRLQR